jgi:hypothetical protein
MFLFTGDQPLDITVYAPQRNTARVEPRGRPRQHQRLLRQWWRQYNAAAQQMVKSGGYPAIADHYLVAMLANRLRLEPTLVGRRLFPSADAEQGLGLLLGTETLHAAMISDVMLRQNRRDAPADQPLPAHDYTPLEIANVPADVPVEKIALHVPQECYYIRFGSFANYRWLRDLTGEFGGDLGNMIAARGLDFDQSGRMEQQLALRETTIGNLFGGTAIADVAVIGLDMFSREGAAVGMLFEARNNGALGNDIAKQRAEAQKKYPAAKQSSVTIAGHTVSLLETPDHAVRSFYAIDGDYHLVTTSRTMVARFYEAGANRGSLGGSNEFRHARQTMPLSRGDTIFAYLSDAFLQNLASPRYRIEMARRVASRVEMDLLAMARYAAKAEGHDYKTVDDLIRGGFLPRDFDRRADAAEITLSEKGVASDSIRGARGAFIPVADMQIDRVSSEEVAAYQSFAANYQSAVGRAEPIMAAIGRRTLTAAELKAAATARAAARKGAAAPDEPKPAEQPRAAASDDPAAPPPPPPGTVASDAPPTKADAPPANKTADKAAKQKPSGPIEVLTIDARVSPFTGKTYQQIASRVGPATTKFVPALPGNLVTINAVLRSGGLASFFPGALRADDDSSRLLFLG